MNSELLLPVGNMAMCLAAVHYGADAIYVGVPFFNARGRSADLTMAELKEMIDLCHLYGVRVNLAFNVVIFQDEYPKVIETLKEILPMGPDAFIVQDLGLAKLIRAMAPNQRIHASTQMTVTNPDAIKLVDDLKIDRFVLGRENSINEIKLIREKTDKELEVFVHGALCVAYSGQCFTSESLGGRSANRGQCAQSCRLEYELFVDEVKKDLGQKKYLVSPKDLMGIEEVPTLKELGVNSFKVEGRLKTPEYVAAAAKNYREVLDGAPVNLEKRTEELSTTYSRGFFSGWLHGVNHQKLVDGTYSAHRGLEIGTIKEIKKKAVMIDSTRDLKAGMGLLFAGPKEDQGSKIFTALRIGKNFEVELLQKDLKLEKGMKVYLNSNEAQAKDLQRGWSSREHMKKIPLKFLVQGLYNEPLLVKVTDPEGREIYAQTISNLAPASARPMTEQFLKDELSSLGTTVYEMGTFECFIQEGLFLNHRELKDVRRELVEKMNQARIERRARVETFDLKPMVKNQTEAGLNILLRSKKQVEGFAENFALFQGHKDIIKSVILDFEFGKDYAASVELIKSLGVKAGIATTRILKPAEYYNLNTIIRCNPDLILVRNLGAIEYLRQMSQIPLIGDFSLNVTNSLSLDYLTSKGLGSVNVSYDLNQDQLLDMLEFSDPSKMEVTLHQYMPEFHMEHCVFAAFMSNGSSFRDCGKPCEKHEVKLKDPYGNMHFLKADQECRNTFFKATPQSAGFLVKELKERGVGSFRLEALNETPEEINLKIVTYLKLIKGEITADYALNSLKVVESYGLGLGQMNKSDTYKDRKKETNQHK
ncbi:U32 family peptidase [Peredibacter starrii]|uniref:U32 family peptidase n=1 Tax=Peredibacter starrii TaxID=28202 RepID=A0AAX4HVC9_9BACT|nr:U32 family peptidase [Peredibacter starrii]WPU67163.1 U32 family peptidase [Peredibacter starrii]